MRYRTIVADPPWELKAGPAHFADNPNRTHTGSSSRPLEYSTMSIAEIADLPVTNLAESDAHLYIWTVNAHLEATYAIARAWGFKPSTLLTWAKTPRGIGLGGTYTLTTEHILFCRRGTCPANARVDSSWWHWPRGKHSAKPEAFLDMVEYISPGPYVELFARRARFGWDYWGDQSLGTAELQEAS